MNQPVNTRSYDLFKTIVALILLIILIGLLLKGVPGAAPAAFLSSATSTQAGAPPLNPTVPPTATASPQPPTPTPTIKPTETSLPSPTPATAPTRQLTPTATPQPPPEPAQAATPTQAAVGCPLALPTRLKVGDTARVAANLNMRTSAGFGNNLILTNPVGTQLSIIGGPVCDPYQGGAYLWWQVKRADSKTGWSAEGSITGRFYFLEPVQ